MVEMERFKSKSALVDHLRGHHQHSGSHKRMMTWTIDELVKAHEEGHKS